MILSNQSIKKLITKGELVIKPFEEKYLGSCSYDLHLGETGTYPESGKEIMLNPNSYLLPNEFILIETKEYLALPDDLVGHLSTRSNAAKLGLLVNFGSELIQPGYSGKIILEIKNLSSKEILLQKGLSLTQIYFEELDQAVEELVSHKKNSKILESRLCEEIKS